MLARGGEGREWMKGLGLGFTNLVGAGGVLDMCLCFGCGGAGGIGGEWVGGLEQGPAGPHSRLAQTTVNRAPLLGAGGFEKNCTAVCD